MTKHEDDLTIDQVLADPIIRTVMRADRVELRHFEALLRDLAEAPKRGTPVVPLSIASKGPRAVRSIFCGVPCA